MGGEGGCEGGEGAGCGGGDDLEFEVGGGGVDVGYEDVAVVFFGGVRGGDGGAVGVLLLGGVIGEGEGVHAVGYGRVVVMPHSLLRFFGAIFGGEEFGPVGGLFGRVGVHRGKTLFEEEFGEVFSVDI